MTTYLGEYGVNGGTTVIEVQTVPEKSANCGDHSITPTARNPS